MRSLILLATFLLAFGRSEAADGQATFEDANCGVSFRYPQDWTAKVASSEDVYDWDVTEVRCRIGLEPPGWDITRKTSRVPLPRYAVNLVVVDQPLVETAHEVGFMRLADLRKDYEAPDYYASRPGYEWWLGRRQGYDPAYSFVTSCCQAVRGLTWGHQEARWGPKASVYTDVAVLNDRNRHSVVVSADPSFKWVLDELQTSFRFVPASN